MEKIGRISGIVLKMAQPLFGRVASIIAGALVTEGVTQEHADLFVNTLGALALVSLDICFVLLKRYEERKKSRDVTF